jgi:glucokinase
MQRVMIGVDIGGTWARVGLVRGEALIAKESFRSRDARDAAGLLKSIRTTAEGLLRGAGISSARVAGLGLGVPGVIRISDGTVLRAPNCPTLDGAPLRSLAAKLVPWPTVVANDTDCAAWAEHRLGGHGFQGLVYITVSTGIGGGIVTGGRLLAGAETTAAEVGHMIVSLGGPRCPCGSNGCLEALASGTAVAAAYRRASGRRAGSATVYAKAASGDAIAAVIVDEAGAALAAGIASLHRLFGLPIVIGGGVTLAGEAFWRPLRRHLGKLRKRPDLAYLQAVPAALSEDRGILGAALLSAASLVSDDSLGYPFQCSGSHRGSKGGGRRTRA